MSIYLYDEWLNLDNKKRYLVNRMHAIKHIHRKILKTKKVKKRISLTSIKCDYCEKTIYKQPSQIRYYKNHFCGRIHHELYKRQINSI